MTSKQMVDIRGWLPTHFPKPSQLEIMRSIIMLNTSLPHHGLTCKIRPKAGAKSLETRQARPSPVVLTGCQATRSIWGPFGSWGAPNQSKNPQNAWSPHDAASRTFQKIGVWTASCLTSTACACLVKIRTADAQQSQASCR